MTAKIENALNESRILVLVAQVILGFQYQAIFEEGFDKLSRSAQYLKLGELGLMLLAFALLISPAAYHQVVLRGNLSMKFQGFITRVTTPTLLPFAMGLGFDFYMAGERTRHRGLGFLLGFLIFLIALFFWYGIEAVVARQEKKTWEDETAMNNGPTSIEAKIKFVLMEVRMVLPGAQALLGFQFAALLTASFEKLPVTLTFIHLASLACVSVCTILLMAPAAFHRIAERGQITERLHTFSSGMLLSAMGFLALGMAGDVILVVKKVTGSWTGAIASATLILCVFYGLWFGYMLYCKAAQPTSLSS